MQVDARPTYLNVFIVTNMMSWTRWLALLLSLLSFALASRPVPVDASGNSCKYARDQPQLLNYKAAVNFRV